MISVDGDTSTNDTVAFTGKRLGRRIRRLQMEQVQIMMRSAEALNSDQQNTGKE